MSDMIVRQSMLISGRLTTGDPEVRKSSRASFSLRVSYRDTTVLLRKRSTEYFLKKPALRFDLKSFENFSRPVLNDADV